MRERSFDVRLARSDMVFRMGDRCDEFHVVVTGQVKLFVMSPASQEKVVELISAGQSLAEAIMFTDRPYILSAQTLTDTLLLSVSKRAVLDEIERDHRFALRMLAGLSRRMHGLVHDVEAYALHSGLQRVIGFLLRDQTLEGCEPSEVRTVSLPVSKATIASLLSLTPEYFSRVLHDLESRGLSEIDRRDIRIIDANRLTAYRLEATRGRFQLLDIRLARGARSPTLERFVNAVKRLSTPTMTPTPPPTEARQP